jgi:hypothetical protein
VLCDDIAKDLTLIRIVGIEDLLQDGVQRAVRIATTPVLL